MSKRTITRIGILLVSLGLLWTIYVQALIHSAERAGYSSDTRDAGIVLGAALWNDVPSPALKERLDKAIAMYRDGYFHHIIVTGGMDMNGSALTEAEGMAAYLIQAGVPEANVVEERKATSTYENLKYSQELMKKNGWNSAFIVTHTYHGARALDIAESLGYSDPAVLLTDSKVMWMPWHKMRETLAFTKWKLEKWLLR